jgi:hypothetical protein
MNAAICACGIGAEQSAAHHQHCVGRHKHARHDHPARAQATHTVPSASGWCGGGEDYLVVHFSFDSVFFSLFVQNNEKKTESL